jgi:hypothetical protein
MNREVFDQGFEHISDTAAHTGNFCRIYALATAVIASASVRGLTAGSNAFTSVPLPAGTFIDGQFSSITLASGRVIAYRSDRG